MNSFSFDKFTLSNGLDVILQEDHALPVAAVNIWYHVGSKDEEPGRTGFAHLFEHVMFEGSKNHNQSFFDPLQKVGAVLNGSTSNDRTNYWEDVPSNYLELALWLESDRMGFLLDALDQGRFDIQRDVVKNERRQSYENRPYGMAGLVLQSVVFPTPHPYSWPVIGSQEDLDSAALEDIHAFFRRFYSPTNASLAIVGDIDLAKVKDMVERYFGDIPPGPSITRVGKMDSDLRGRVSLTMQDRVQLSRLYLVWPTSPAFSADEAPLDMLSTVLGDGKSSRFYRSLVYEKQIAKDARVMHHAQEIAGEFHIQVTANPGHSLEEIEEAVRFELDRIVKEPPTEKEMTRAKNRVQSHYVRQTQKFGGFGGRADLLNSYNTYLGDPGYIRKDLDRYLAVSSEDIVRVASTVLGRDHVGLTVLPEETLSAASSVVDRASAPAASGAPSFEPPVPERHRLGNGMSVVVLERTGVSLVAMGLLLRSGAAGDPTDQPGLTDMMMALLPEGTTNRDSRQISDDMEFLGAQLASEASREHAILSTEALTQHWTEALEIISDIAKNANFPEEEFERVRREHVTDLQRISDNPTTIALRASRGLVFGADTRYGHPLSGTEKSVGSLDRGLIVKRFGRMLRPDDATLLVVGDVSMDDVLSQAESRFGDWRSDAGAHDEDGDGYLKDVTEATTIYLADKPGAAQSVIRAGHLTIPRHHKDYHALNLANYIFGGQFAARLNMNLRQDKGYSYGYMSSIDWFTHGSALMAGGAVQTDVTKEAVVETLKEFTDIRNGRPVTQEEFDNARDGILRGLPSQFETYGQTLHQLVRLVSFDLPDDYFVQYVDRLKALSLADVHRAVKERFDGDHLKVLVVGDASIVEPGLKELGLPVVRVDYEGRVLD